MVVDGLLTAAIGPRFVRLWEVGPGGHPYRRVIRWLADRPPWLLRTAGLLEAGVGFALLGSAPLSVRDLYGATADLYGRIETDWRDWLYADAHRAFDQEMLAHLSPTGHVLDLGCGTGANLARLLASGQPFGSYTGVDLTAEMLARAREKGVGREDVRLRELDLDRDPLPAGPFDLIVSTWVFEHLEDPEDVVHKAWARLRPGGHMVLLFEIATSYRWGKVVDRVLRFFSARHVPEDVALDFPGLVSMNRYRGAFGDLALLLLHKPD